MSLQTVKRNVETILRQHPRTRESDNVLIPTYWWIHDRATECKTALEVMHMIADGKLTGFESITRSRRLLQNEFPELRGKNYRERHAKQEEYKEFSRS
jgi:predicted nucleic acid-binding Zn ribbon protein